MNNNIPFVGQKMAKVGLMLGTMLVAASLGFGFNAKLISSANASDLDVTEESNDGRFVRMGLNKSVVVRLPANARDVIVGNPDIVDAVVRTKNTAYLFARKVGQTNVFFFDADGNQILNLDLEVALDVTAIRKLLGRTLPGTGIVVDTVNNNVILSGIAKNQLEAKTAVDLANQFVTQGSLFSGGGSAVINTIKVAGEDQVMLKVKVVEIQRDVLKQFGIDFQTALKMGSNAFKFASINPFASDLIAPNSGYASAGTSLNGSFDSVVRAMESDGLLRTLAEPNLTAQTGAEAKFRAGGEFPYCKDKDEKGVCTWEYKEFGISVDFSPTVLDEGRINLKIKTEVSEIAQNVGFVEVPSVNKRAAETILELPSGGSMMIAGLIRESTRQAIKGTPGLKKLPVLGALFRSRDFASNETELVIMVTPYLVRPTGEQQLVTPDKGFNAPTEHQTLFLGRLNKIYGVKGKGPEGTYNGNVGFIVE